MEATAHDLPLRYLLELSTDIRSVLLMGEDGALLAAAPGSPSARVVAAGRELVREARELSANGRAASVELDISVERGAVFLVGGGGRALVCVTGPFSLPGLILHDMRVVLKDLRGAGGQSSDGEAGGPSA